MRHTKFADVFNRMNIRQNSAIRFTWYGGLILWMLHVLGFKGQDLFRKYPVIRPNLSSTQLSIFQLRIGEILSSWITCKENKNRISNISLMGGIPIQISDSSFPLSSTVPRKKRWDNEACFCDIQDIKKWYSNSY